MVNQKPIPELTSRPALFDYHSILKCVHFTLQFLALEKEWIWEWLSLRSIYSALFLRWTALVVVLCVIHVRKDTKKLSPTMTLVFCLKSLSDYGREQRKPQVQSSWSGKYSEITLQNYGVGLSSQGWVKREKHCVEKVLYKFPRVISNLWKNIKLCIGWMTLDKIKQRTGASQRKTTREGTAARKLGAEQLKVHMLGWGTLKLRPE